MSPRAIPFLRSTRSPYVLALLGLLACTAPRSRPAEGPVGEAVERALASGTASFAHERWDRLLAEGTRDGLVDYGAFAARRDELDIYLDRLAAADLANLSGPHLEALLINAYNAYTVASILDHPGVESIREIDGVWKKADHRVGGFAVSLRTATRPVASTGCGAPLTAAPASPLSDVV